VSQQNSLGLDVSQTIEQANNQQFEQNYSRLLINLTISQIHYVRTVNNGNEIVNTSQFSDINMRWPWYFNKSKDSSNPKSFLP